MRPVIHKEYKEMLTHGVADSRCQSRDGLGIRWRILFILCLVESGNLEVLCQRIICFSYVASGLATILKQKPTH